MPSTRRGGAGRRDPDRDPSLSETRTSRSGAVRRPLQTSLPAKATPVSPGPKSCSEAAASKITKQAVQPPASGALSSSAVATSTRARRTSRSSGLGSSSPVKPEKGTGTGKVKGDKQEEGEEEESSDGTICISTFLAASDIAVMPTLTASALGKQQARQRRASKSSSSTITQTQQPNEEKSKERNIDQVIFGDVAFKAWYPSYYPAAVLGKGKGDTRGDGIDVGKGIVVERLYVCGTCFAYSREVVEWWGHVKACERERRGKEVPGKRIYVHGAGAGDLPKESGTWSIWEVDGAVETLFCQSLSLFAKLFLDNKSVFFDVNSFNYFLLVYTPPSTPSKPSKPQIVGFFSKEKMSWDNNNLACILVFPPWQRKGLGALLMGVSYEISRREGILGGPEKPISELGRKGYKRFWGGEISRWLLNCKETDRKKGRGLVDVEKISKETWIYVDDCLGVLREMGVVEKAGRGKGTVERVRVDKERVREWVKNNRVDLERTVDEGGFVEGYGMRKSLDESMGD